jgi:uncharacterized protein YigE (DUF2233 family)
MTRRSALAITVLLGTAAAAIIGAALRFRKTTPGVALVDPADLPGLCRPLTFEGVAYLVCEIDTRSLDVGIFHADQAGKAFGSLDAFEADARARGTPPLLSMNAGMYHEDLSPVGLLVEGGVEKAPAEPRDGEGNFFLKPNGVLSIGRDGTVSIMETGAYLAAGLKPASATQSGPMLVIGGEIHPKFLPNGTSRFLRNGAGVRDPHTLLLAISLEEVSLGSFARLFRDGLGCPDALFFDGAISALSNGRKTVLGGRYPVGPIIAVNSRRE